MWDCHTETGAERKRLEGVRGRREKVEDGEGEGKGGGAKQVL